MKRGGEDHERARVTAGNVFCAALALGVIATAMIAVAPHSLFMALVLVALAVVTSAASDHLGTHGTSHHDRAERGIFRLRPSAVTGMLTGWSRGPFRRSR